jgi:protein-L-isoaspartate O-methyltransferase
MQDTYKHKGLRKQLIDELRQKGITDENILDAFNEVPRHFFLDLALALDKRFHIHILLLFKHNY